jgi:phosphoglycerol transferase MdoB-like AlkP superfamily enzyme
MKTRVAPLCFGMMAVVLGAKFLVLNAEFAVEEFPLHRVHVPATIAIVTFLVVPLLWLPRAARIPALLGLNALLTTLVVANRIYLRFFGDVLSAAAFAHAGQVISVMPGVAERIEATDVLLLLDVEVGAAVWAFWLRRSEARAEWPEMRPGTAPVMLLMAALLAVIPARLIWLDPEEVFLYSTRRRETVAALGVLPYRFYDLARHLHQLTGRLAVSAGDRQRVQAFFEQRRARGVTSSPLFGRAYRRNVIVIMAESLTSLPLNLRIEGQEVTPALSRFARESIHFTNFFDQTHLGTTADAEVSSMQAVLPLPDGVTSTRYAANQFAGLPAILGEHGYDTLSANVMPGDFWNMRQMHQSLGFSRSYFRGEFMDGESFGMWLTDEVFFKQIEANLYTAREPFLAFLITLSNHLPYELPPHHRHLDLGDLEGTTVGRYLNSVHYFDRAFGALIDRLNASGLLDRSMLVVYGDHRAFWEKTPEVPTLLGFSADDRFRLWKAERRLPLLIRLPAPGRGERSGTAGKSRRHRANRAVAAGRA